MKNQIYFDQQGYNGFKRDFINPTNLLQKVVDSFNSLKIGSLNTKEFQLLFTDTVEDVLFDKITSGQDLVLNGIKLDKKKALDIIQKPNGYEGFFETLKSVKKGLGHDDLQGHIRFTRFNAITNYVINDKGNVDVDPVMLENEKTNRFTYYTTTQNQDAYYKALTDFIAAIQSIVDNGLYFSKPDVFEHIDEFVKFDTTNKKFKIQYDKLAYFFGKNLVFNK